MILLWWLLVGHAMADFVLQSGEMAKGKHRHRRSDPPPGAQPQTVWPYWLTAHAFIHGGAVALVTGSVGFGVAETLAHWAIDFGKCENWYGVHVDQFLHVLSKVLWLMALGWLTVAA